MNNYSVKGDFQCPSCGAECNKTNTASGNIYVCKSCHRRFFDDNKAPKYIEYRTQRRILEAKIEREVDSIDVNNHCQVCKGKTKYEKTDLKSGITYYCKKCDERKPDEAIKMCLDQLYDLGKKYPDDSSNDSIYYYLFIKIFSRNYQVWNEKISSFENKVSYSSCDRADAETLNVHEKSLKNMISGREIKLVKSREKRRKFTKVFLIMALIVAIGWTGFTFMTEPEKIVGNSTFTYVNGANSIVVETVFNQEFSITPPKKTGHTFLGVFDQKVGGTMFIDKDGKSVNNCNWLKSNSVTFYAQFKVNSYKVTFVDVVNGETKKSEITVEYNKPITFPTPNPNGLINNTFIGWKYGTSTYRVSDVPPLMPAENVTITSVWQTNEWFKITELSQLQHSMLWTSSIVKIDLSSLAVVNGKINLSTTLVVPSSVKEVHIKGLNDKQSGISYSNFNIRVGSRTSELEINLINISISGASDSAVISSDSDAMVTLNTTGDVDITAATGKPGIKCQNLMIKGSGFLSIIGGSASGLTASNNYGYGAIEVAKVVRIDYNGTISLTGGDGRNGIDGTNYLRAVNDSNNDGRHGGDGSNGGAGGDAIQGEKLIVTNGHTLSLILKTGNGGNGGNGGDGEYARYVAKNAGNGGNGGNGGASGILLNVTSVEVNTQIKSVTIVEGKAGNGGKGGNGGHADEYWIIIKTDESNPGNGGKGGAAGVNNNFDSENILYLKNMTKANQFNYTKAALSSIGVAGQKGQEDYY